MVQQVKQVTQRKQESLIQNSVIACRHCPRLRRYQDKNAVGYPDYWNKPVPASGKHQGLSIIGLAPGLHGANKTGVPFTGDASGDLLFRCLRALNIETKVQITNAVKCAPPQNAPMASEKKNCRKFLVQELEAIRLNVGPNVLFCLGRIAHEETLKCLELPAKKYKFAHGAVHQLEPNLWIVDSYHCSRYNIQTNRLTESMFLSALQCAVTLAHL